MASSNRYSCILVVLSVAGCLVGCGETSGAPSEPLSKPQAAIEEIASQPMSAATDESSYSSKPSIDSIRPGPSGVFRFAAIRSASLSSSDVPDPQSVDGDVRPATNPVTLSCDLALVGSTGWQVTRISNPDDFVEPTRGPVWNNFGPQYPLIQHFNKDNSRLLVRALAVDSSGASLPHYLNTSLHVVDALRGRYIGPAEIDGQGLSAQWRWSNTDPDEILFLPFADEPSIQVGHFGKGAINSRSFAKEGFTGRSAALFGGVGAQSADDRYWPLTMRRGDQWYVAVWDRIADRLLTELPIASDTVDGDYHAATGMSHSGEYFWITSRKSWLLAGDTIPPGVNVFRRNGTYLRTLSSSDSTSNPISHTGSTTDVHGNDVWVWIGSQDGGETTARHILSWRFDGLNPGGAHSSHGTIQVPQGQIPGLHYLSTVAAESGGWVLVSDYPVPTGNENLRRFPMRGMIWAFRLDESGTVVPIADAVAARKDYSPELKTYFYGAFATPNRDLSSVLFRSGQSTNWQDSVPGTFHAYMARQQCPQKE